MTGQRNDRTSATETTPIPHWHTPDRDTVNLTDGDGTRVYDDEGREYLDFLSQLYCVNAGHGNEAITDAIEEQLDSIAYVSSAKHNDTRTELAAALRDITPDSTTDVFFSISGSEANEAALQLARAYQDAPKVLTRWRSYHGGTYGTGGLTGDPDTRTAVERYAATTGVTKFLPPLAHRAPFDADTPEALAEQAADHLDVEPDMITFAKGVTSAYVPLAGVATSPDLARHFRNEGLSVGQTFAGHPVGCAAGIAAISEYRGGLLENARQLAPVLKAQLESLEERFDAVGNVHGRGFLWSVEFSEILVAPPFCVTEQDITAAVSTLADAIEAVFE